MTFRSILCPVDFSPQSLEALQYAGVVARRFGGRVTVVFVNDPLLLAAASAAYRGRRQFVERSKAELASFVERATRQSGSEAREHVAAVVAVGNPAEEILRQVKRRRCDLIVMGSHGLSGIPKVFFGSTTEQVLRTANVPVLAIPPSLESRRKSKPLGEVARVIAPIDLAGEWQSDVIRAAQVAAEFGAELLLVHVLAPVQLPPWLRAGRASDRHRVDKATRALERVRARLFPADRAVSTSVIIGSPAREIARLTRSSGALVVMSLRGTAGVWGMRRGSIAYHVLTQSSTPVLALPRRRLGGRFAARARTAIGAMLTTRDRAELAGIDALLSVAARPKKLEP